ncbi:MAG: putative maltokinase, partial [Thaumarchaeota archaeon]|nr:putative maltokinase [Nitrososphaerota archaeon]
TDIYYTEGLPESYILPLAYSGVDISEKLRERNPDSILAKVSIDKNTPGVLFDAVYDEAFRAKLLEMIIGDKTTRGGQSEILGKASEPNFTDDPSKIKTSTSSADQSNTSLVYADKYILKLIRRIEEGPNPEVEISAALLKNGFEFSPKVLGTVSFRAPAAESAAVGLLEQYIRNEGDAWSLFQGQFDRFSESILSKKTIPQVDFPQSVLEISEMILPEPLLEEISQPFEGWITLLGKRTGEFHLALLKDVDDPNFAPESFGYLEQVATAQSMTSYSNRIFQLSRNASGITEDSKKELDQVLSYQYEIVGRISRLKQIKLDSVRSRIHGDYHLGQVLFTGKDFVIIDFEGEPARSLSDRRLKRSPIKDVAGMIRSFHYAAYSVLFKKTSVKKEDRELLLKAADVWYKAVTSLFLKSYLNTVGKSPILPSDKNALSVLLDAYLIDKAVYELGYEINNRPQWISIPLKGIEDLVGVKTDLVSAPKNIAAQ